MKRYAWRLALVLPGAMAFADVPKPLDWPQWQGLDPNARIRGLRSTCGFILPTRIRGFQLRNSKTRERGGKSLACASG